MAAALGIGRESARVLTKRKRWQRRAGNDGRARVGVPEEAFSTRADTGADPRIDPGADRQGIPWSDPGSSLDQNLDMTELRIRNGHLEARLETLQALLEAEKQRAERERQLLEKAIEETRDIRDRATALAVEAAAVPALRTTIEALRSALDSERGRTADIR